ncbi:MAG TPA: alkaline phosphatase family protein, partial [Limnochordia bacterium]
EFHSWLVAEGFLERGIFLVCADHGQSDGIGGHGHLGPGERYVPFIVWGEGIARGRVVATPHSIVSVAATLSYWLGAPLPSRARGPVLVEAMADWVPAENAEGEIRHADVGGGHPGA